MLRYLYTYHRGPRVAIHELKRESDRKSGMTLGCMDSLLYSYFKLSGPQGCGLSYSMLESGRCKLL